MRRILSSVALAVALTFIPAVHAAGDESAAEVDNLDLSVDENIAMPQVPPKARAYVKSAMDQLRRYFLKYEFAVAPVRDAEVLQVTIPCSRLFGANSTELKPSAAAVLKPFGIVVLEPDKYKVLVTVHTDDTGDDMYADSITAARANAIDDYLWQLADGRDTNVIPYGIARDDLLQPNTSITNRAANRRVELYIIPDKGMLRAAGVKVK